MRRTSSGTWGRPKRFQAIVHFEVHQRSLVLAKGPSSHSKALSLSPSIA